MFHKVFKCKIVNAFRTKNNISSSINDLFASLSGDIHFSLSDHFNIIWVINKDLDSHL